MVKGSKWQCEAAVALDHGGSRVGSTRLNYLFAVGRFPLMKHVSFSAFPKNIKECT